MSITSRLQHLVSGGFVLAALLGAAPVSALDPALAITQYSLRNWQTDQGLPQNSVFDVLQTRDGYLWLATQEGLARFDGVRFEVFNKRNTPAIHHNDVWTLHEDRAGTLWIGTRGGGLTRYRDGVFSNIGKAEGLSDDAVQALVEDADGSLWIGTRGGGLNRYHNGKFTTWSSKQGLANDTVFALAKTRDGTLWMGTDGGGISRYAGGKFSGLTVKDGLASDIVFSLLEDRAGSLWIGTSAGLNRWQDGKLSSFHVKDGLSNDNIRTLFEDRDGSLWIGTDGGGLNRWRDGRFTAFGSKDGLSSDSIGAIFEDAEGSLWVGSDAGGLSRFKDGKFVSLTAKEGLSNDNARSIFQDRAGAVWIGTFEGLNRYQDGKFTAWRKKDGLSSEVILSIAEGQDGSLWLGTLGGGLNRFLDGKFTAYTKKDGGLSNDTVLSLLTDRKGVLWIGTRSGGLNRYENGVFSNYTTANGLSSNDVRALLEAADGSLWIGTLGGGLNHFQDGKFTAITTKDGLSHDLILSLYEDQDGALWAGSFGGGLNRIKNGKISAITTKNGLFDDVIFQILDDGVGGLWMSSNHGVFRVALAELNAFAEGRAASVQSVAYGKADGMKNAECNGAHQPAGWKTRDGKLWFPTIQGVSRVDPAALGGNPRPPPVVIEAVRVDGEALVNSGAALPAGRQKLEFRYTALSYREPEKVQFKYQLVGFDKNWVAAGASRSATYTNLPPGNYRFLVAASNEDGVWNETGAAFAFSQEPFFWQRTSFYLVYLFGALGLFALGARANRARVKRLEAREQELLTLMAERKQAQDELAREHTALTRSNAELEQFAHVAAHDLREPLRGVASYSQLLVRRLPREDTDAAEFSGYIFEGVQRMQNMLDGLLAYTSLSVQQRRPAVQDARLQLEAALAQLRETINSSAAVISQDPLPSLPIIGNELSQVFLHLIGNALKFRSEAPPQIHIGAAREGGTWRFTVSDRGLGVPAEHAERIFGLFQRLHPREQYPGSGLGLAICKKIVEREGGRIGVEAREGGGSVFYFTLPAGAEAA